MAFLIGFKSHHFVMSDKRKSIKLFFVEKSAKELKTFAKNLGLKTAGGKASLISLLTQKSFKNVKALNKFETDFDTKRIIEVLPVIINNKNLVVFVRVTKYGHVCLNDIFSIKSKGLRETKMEDWLQIFGHEIVTVRENGGLFVKIAVGITAAKSRGEILSEPLKKVLRKFYPKKGRTRDLILESLVKNHPTYQTLLRKVRKAERVKKTVYALRAENETIKASALFKLFKWFYALFQPKPNNTN